MCCVCRCAYPEANIRCLLLSLSALFIGFTSHWTWGLVVQFNWLENKLQKSVFLPPFLQPWENTSAGHYGAIIHGCRGLNSGPHPWVVSPLTNLPIPLDIIRACFLSIQAERWNYCHRQEMMKFTGIPSQTCGLEIRGRVSSLQREKPCLPDAWWKNAGRKQPRIHRETPS